MRPTACCAAGRCDRPARTSPASPMASRFGLHTPAFANPGRTSSTRRARSARRAREPKPEPAPTRRRRGILLLDCGHVSPLSCRATSPCILPGSRCVNKARLRRERFVAICRDPRCSPRRTPRAGRKRFGLGMGVLGPVARTNRVDGFADVRTAARGSRERASWPWRRRRNSSPIAAGRRRTLRLAGAERRFRGVGCRRHHGGGRRERIERRRPRVVAASS